MRESRRRQFRKRRCTKEKAGGGFEWVELTETEEVTSSGELELEDSKASGGAVAVKCSGANTGWVANSTGGTGGDGVTTIKNIKCKLVKAGLCEKLTFVSPVNLPWGTTLEERENEVRDAVISGIGAGAPGWQIRCKTFLGEITDTCTRSGNTANVRANSSEGSIEEVFDKRTEEETMATCTVGGVNTGRISGTVITKARQGGVRVEPLFHAENPMNKKV
jgi:hypothetical protein